MPGDSVGGRVCVAGEGWVSWAVRDDGPAVLYRGSEVLARGRHRGTSIETTEGEPVWRQALKSAWRWYWGA